MHVGVVSPNAMFNIADENAAYDDPDQSWGFDNLAKRASLLFDKLYLTDNLDLTREIVGHYDEADPKSQTLQYLEDRGLILRPQDLGFATGAQFIGASIKGSVADLHDQLLRVGNPSNNCEPGDCTYVGQPDIGDFEAHDGTHPRSERGWDDPDIEVLEARYESLLLARNAAMLRQAGLTSVAIVGRLRGQGETSRDAHPAWEVVIREMPDFDVRAPWEDVFGFRAEERTQHLIRSLRRWLRKIVSEDWSPAELEDEIRELVYEYEVHLRANRLVGGTGMLTCLITGTADVAESLVKFRLTHLAELVSAALDRSGRLRQAELTAPGHELALLSELKKPI